MELIKKYWRLIVAVFVVCMFTEPALCFLLLGMPIFYIGLSAILFLRKMSTHGVEWTGKVVEYRSDSDGDKRPVIEFTLLSGDVVRNEPFVHGATGLSMIKSAGKLTADPVPILYDPDYPARFVIKNNEGTSYFVMIVFMLGGLFFVGLSICWLLGYVKMG